MLALSRKKDESIMLGNDIEITVLEIRGDQVKIGVKAPKNVAIFRKEIYDQIEAENKKAAEQNVDRKTIENLFNI
ncbi:MAG: carbon storage regulator CsrA [Lachnospiraceae bacterium]|nr:carbon storage regulator CsrA [Lachnospiraceae bacterium]